MSDLTKQAREIAHLGVSLGCLATHSTPDGSFTVVEEHSLQCETLTGLIAERLRASEEARERAEQEEKRLQAWVHDLQSGMYVNCVYCGHRYGPGETTPVTMADALKAHVEQCSKHPMSALRAQLEKAEREREALREALREIDRTNSHSGSGPHCTCSQRERERIVVAALAGAPQGGEEPKHVCGATGYGQPEDVCPGCLAWRGQWCNTCNEPLSPTCGPEHRVPQGGEEKG